LGGTIDTYLLYIFVGIFSSLIIVMPAILSRRGGSIVSKEVRNILETRLSGLVPGYGCSSLRTENIFLRPEIAPEGFEGNWQCCLLGAGGWGYAYLCRQNDREVVFKIPRGYEPILKGADLTVERTLLEKIWREAEEIEKLNHRNIIWLLGYSKNSPILVYEYANYGTLEWQMREGYKPSLRDALIIAVQVGDALRYIHSRGLIHGDIKPGNIFIKDGVAKLGDFSSITRLLTLTSKHPVGSAYTPGYEAPEQVYSDLANKARKEGFENRVDVYQLGNLILKMIAGFSIDGKDLTDDSILTARLGKVGDREVRSLLESMMKRDPSERISADEAVRRIIELLKKRTA